MRLIKSKNEFLFFFIKVKKSITCKLNDESLFVCKQPFKQRPFIHLLMMHSNIKQQQDENLAMIVLIRIISLSEPQQQQSILGFVAHFVRPALAAIFYWRPSGQMWPTGQRLTPNAWPTDEAETETAKVHKVRSWSGVWKMRPRSLSDFQP